MARSRTSTERRLRAALGRIGFARSLYAFGQAVRRAWRDSDRNAATDLNQWYSSGADPWGYASVAEEQERYATALSLLDASLSGSRPKALEIGCGEGLFTAELASRCESVLAVDISDVSLERAKGRLANDARVEFRQWNIREDPVPGTFDLIVCMDVICAIHRPTAQRRAIRNVIRPIAPGGHVLVSAVIQNQTIEGAAWARVLGEGGGWVIEQFASSPGLQQAQMRSTDKHLIALYNAAPNR
jgi:2-polyprenyl-3-methyl-5-hydroxy-6-metoxy-1,4-benzoquinol methylase